MSLVAVSSCHGTGTIDDHQSSRMHSTTATLVKQHSKDDACILAACQWSEKGFRINCERAETVAGLAVVTWPVKCSDQPLCILMVQVSSNLGSTTAHHHPDNFRAAATGMLCSHSRAAGCHALSCQQRCVLLFATVPDWLCVCVAGFRAAWRP